VKALENEGIQIREAATHERPSAEVFEFKPAPTSPIYANFARQSIDGNHARTNSWRGSMQSLASADRGTQTDEDESKTSPVHSPLHGSLSGPHSPARKTTQHVIESGDEQDDRSPYAHSGSGVSTPDEDSEIHEAKPVLAQAKVVTIPKRVPPSLPPRNPQRMSSPVKDRDDAELADGFDSVSLNPDRDENGASHPEEQFHSIPPSPVMESHHKDFI